MSEAYVPLTAIEETLRDFGDNYWQTSAGNDIVRPLLDALRDDDPEESVTVEVRNLIWELTDDIICDLYAEVRAGDIPSLKMTPTEDD